MNTETLLAKTMAGIITDRFAAGTAYLRVPELSSPMPIAELLHELDSAQGLRIAIFVDDLELPNSASATSQLEAWRQSSIGGMTRPSTTPF